VVATLTKEFKEVEAELKTLGDWQEPTLEELTKVCRHADGSAGTDGWQGQELKHLPAAAIQQFRAITHGWLIAGKAPGPLKEVRQVNLQKPAKVTKELTLETSGTRPICVESVWWRVYMTTWTTSTLLARWRQIAIPPEVVGGKGSLSAEEGAAELFYALEALGYAGTLDYSACYDMMPPDINSALEELRVEAGVVQLA